MGVGTAENPKTQFLTTGQVAAHCGVTFRTVIRWIKKGYIHAQRLPGRGDYRIELEDFISFLNRHKMKVPAPYAKSTTNQRVLIVDNDSRFCESMERTLQEFGFETKIAFDGFQAGLMIGSFQPALICMDLMMPGTNGFDAIQLISKLYVDGGSQQPKILVVSGDSAENLKRALAIGAHDTLSKPFEKSMLSSKIKNLLGHLPAEDVIQETKMPSS